MRSYVERVIAVLAVFALQLCTCMNMVILVLPIQAKCRLDHIISFMCTAFSSGCT